MPRIEGETYFNNFLQSGYEELSSWTPEYYRNVLEADAALRYAGDLVDLMAVSLEEICENQFVKSMDGEMLSRMESFFHLMGNASLPVDERRRLLAVAMSGTGKMNREKIADIIRTYTGAEADFAFPSTVFHIYVDIPENGPAYSASTLMRELSRKVPAHLAYIAHFSTIIPVNLKGTEAILVKNLNIRFGAEIPEFVEAGLQFAFEAQTKEEVPLIQLITRGKNAWLLDGSVLLNGSRLLDAVYKKEVIQ